MPFGWGKKKDKKGQEENEKKEEAAFAEEKVRQSQGRRNKPMCAHQDADSISR